ncbi:TIGR00159 family protein [Spirosoma sp. KCTC 42546]|uniref:diadenylate cyclase CdaA n=1 Tax=Spirosoma sp. KCTC 42546 TaxID=2520506 RepID=UPI00115BCE45|nr:diadenylate cyclase CdaA [Spirosoma sp. KCTC 42546]QDK79542.1 TIGR00159 family protein [Spirosoma sp. KCTC 42546]
MLAFRLGFLDIGWLDLLDIGLVAILIYQIYNLVRGSVASRVFVGYLLVYLAYLLVKALGLNLMTTILEYFISVGALALIIIFQHEIRRFLLLIGKSTNLTNSRLFRRWLLRDTDNVETQTPLKPVLDTCKALSGEFSGGLLVLQKNDDLEKFAQSGEVIDADISKPLLLAIFSQYSPLHDGAVIISEGRIRAARCILPVSEDDELPPSLGFRHRAALGMSEATDAAVIAVSEESGRLSLALNGELFTNLSQTELESRLENYLREPGVKA